MKAHCVKTSEVIHLVISSGKNVLYDFRAVFDVDVKILQHDMVRRKHTVS